LTAKSKADSEERVGPSWCPGPKSLGAQNYQIEN